MKLLPLTQNKNTLVDDDVFLWAGYWRWYAYNSRNKYYAYNPNRPEKNQRHLHRLILNPDPALFVDHINGNGLDNRRANLRTCTNAENKRAKTHRCKAFLSQYRGVQWANDKNKWRAQITIGGKGKTIGLFISEVEAAKAYDAAAQTTFGQFADLNFSPLQNRKLVYLACPYSSPDPETILFRHKWATIAAAEITKAEATVFSPVSHSHELAEQVNLPRDWDFWKRIDWDYLDHTQLLVVLTLPGWKESTGVTAEIEYAHKTKIPIEYLDPVHLQYAKYQR